MITFSIRGLKAPALLLFAWIGICSPRCVEGAIGVGPHNDNFENALVLKGKAPSFSGTTRGATLEPGEPNHGGGSVWYSWTAPVSGRLKLVMPKWPYQTFLGVYTGSSVSNLTLLANDWDGGWWKPATDCAVQAGVSYKIAVVGTGGELPQFAVKSSLTLPPLNDDFEHRAVLPGYGGKSTVNTFGATWQPGEPEDRAPIGYGLSHRTVWWTWTAPVKGRVSFNTDSDFAATMGVYSGDAFSNLVLVGYGPAFDVPAGTTYQISIDGYGGGSGNLKLTASFYPAPPNDDFEHSQVVTGAVVALSGTTMGATPEPGEPPHPRVGLRFSVWYSWTAPASSYVTVYPLEGPVRAGMAVYTGSSVSNLTTVATGENGTVSFPATQGTTYHISVVGWEYWQSTFDLQLVMSTVRLTHPLAGQPFPVGSKILVSAESSAFDGSGSWLYYIVDSHLLGKVPRNDSTAYLLNAPLGSHTLSAAVISRKIVHLSAPVTFYVRPVNDAFADRTILPQSDVSVDGTSAAATLEPGEPPFGGILAQENDVSVWYSWTAPSNAPARVSTTGGDLDVFTGDTLTNLTLLRPDVWGVSGSYQFQALAGTTYSIRVSGEDFTIPSGAGNFHLTLSQITPPPNDDFTNRATLAGYAPKVTGSLYGSSTEPGEPNAASNAASVWYSWTAPGRGLVYVTNSAYSIAIFKGDSVSALTNGYSPFRTSAGDIFQIQVFTAYHYGDTAPMPFDLGLTLWPPPPNDDFSQPVVLSGSSVSTNGYFAGATLQPGERSPFHENASVWYSWTAPASGPVTLIGSGVSQFSVVAYTGNSVSNLSLIATNTWVWNGAVYSQLNFDAIAGTNYAIGFFSYDGSLGTFQFSLAMTNVSPGPIDDTRIARALTPVTSVLQSQVSPPILTNPTFQSPEYFQFELKGSAGSQYAILSGTNLFQPESTWKPLLSTNLSSDSVIIRVDRATNNQQFYRARRERP